MKINYKSGVAEDEINTNIKPHFSDGHDII